MSAFSKYRKRRQDKYLRKCARLAQMRAAKARKRQALIEAGLLEREPKLARWHRFEFGVRDKQTGEMAWHDLVSVRHAAKALGLILKYIRPHPDPLPRERG
jgi:hypothetical protein